MRPSEKYEKNLKNTIKQASNLLKTEYEYSTLFPKNLKFYRMLTSLFIENFL